MLHVNSFHGFLGKNPPDISKHHGDGVFEHEDGYIHHSGTKSTKFKSLDAAHEFAEARRSKYKKDLINANSEMKKHYNISDSDAKAIGQYANHLGPINHKLIKGEALNDRESGFVNSLDSAIRNHKAHDDLILYSGTNKDHAERLRSQEVVHHPSFISTSISPSAARSFATQKGGDIVKIHVPKGHPGVYIHGVTNYEGEREFVLPKGLNLRIHPDKEETLIHDDKAYRVHHATIE